MAVLFLLASVFIAVRFGPEIITLVKEPAKFREMLISYGYASVIVFIFFQILQVVIAAIPGELIQLAGGYVYGTLPGTLYSTIGIFLGALLVFNISRFIGYPILEFFVPPEKMGKFKFLINNKKVGVAMFILFLIPGIPKDLLVYLAGITPIKPAKFFPILIIARMPGIIGSSFIGVNIYEKHYITVVIVSVISTLLFLLGVLFKDKALSKVHGFFHK